MIAKVVKEKLEKDGQNALYRSRCTTMSASVTGQFRLAT